MSNAFFILQLQKKKRTVNERERCRRFLMIWRMRNTSGKRIEIKVTRDYKNVLKNYNHLVRDVMKTESSFAS